MIRNLLATLGRRGPTSAADRPAKSAGQKTVFAIDDHPDSLHALCLALADEPYRLETAGNAEEATRKLSYFHPELILVDSQIPAVDGTRLARCLFADEDLTPVPIVALVEAGAGHGIPPSGSRFDGSIGKPIDALTLPGQVCAFLESSRRAASSHSADLQVPDTPTANRRQRFGELLDWIEAGLPDSQFANGTRSGLQRLANVVGEHQHHELVEYLQQAERLSHAATARARNRFRSVIRLSHELLCCGPDVAPGMAELRAGYLDNRRAELSRLEDVLRNGDFATLRKAGHNIKGTGAAYGFAELTDIGRALEAAAKDGDAGAIEVLLDQIDAYIDIVRRSPEHRGDYAARI